MTSESKEPPDLDDGARILTIEMLLRDDLRNLSVVLERDPVQSVAEILDEIVEVPPPEIVDEERDREGEVSLQVPRRKHFLRGESGDSRLECGVRLMLVRVTVSHLHRTMPGDRRTLENETKALHAAEPNRKEGEDE